MKNILTFILVTGLLISSPSWGSGLKAQVTAEITYQTFYDQLSPYGRWVAYPGYGYVWCPAVAAGFRPYATAGHWVWTDEGWCWVSDYSWGWAPFHYGRWFFDAGYGWLWVPGYDWSPAWVAWRSGEGCYGWAPICPGFSISVGFAAYDPPVNYWCFAPQRYIVSPFVGRYYLGASQNLTFVRQTTIINNYTYSNHVYRGGPPITEVQHATDREISPVPVHAASRPGSASFGQAGLSLYHPAVAASTGSASAPHSLAHFRGTPHPSLPAGVSAHPDEYAGQSALASARSAHSQSAVRHASANPVHSPARNGSAAGNTRHDVAHGNVAHRQNHPSSAYNGNHAVTHGGPSPHRGPGASPAQHPPTAMHRPAPPRPMPAQHPPTVMHRPAPPHPAPMQHPAPPPHAVPQHRAAPEHRVS